MGPRTADHSVGHTVPYPRKLWRVGEVIQQPHYEVGVHSCLLQLVPQKRSLDGVEGIGEIIKHDSHSALRLLQVRETSVQEVDHCIINPDAGLVGKLLGLVGKLQWVQ